MKRISIVAVAIFTMILIGMIFIQAHEKETDVTRERTKVGMVLNGNKNDASWNQAHYEGMEGCAEDLNLEVVYKENIVNTENCKMVIEELIEQGCKIIVCDSFDHNDWVQQVAKKYPQIYFLHATGVGYEENLSTFFGRIYQMRYLSGIVAGLQTETNEIGYVAAMPLDEVNRGINAFTLGVRSVNPEAVVYVEWSNAWSDDTLVGEATNRLLEGKNIDVLTMHTDSNRPLEIAEEKGIWSIGYNIDNQEKYPNTFLTAPVWQWKSFYEDRILECLQGKFKGQHYWEDANTRIVSLVKFTDNVKEGIGNIVQQEWEKLKSGTWDVFYGPIKEQNGTIKIHEGESMTDYSMLNEFNWYVEGVVVNEK